MIEVVHVHEPDQRQRPAGWRWFYQGAECFTDINDVRRLSSEQLFAFDVEITAAEALAAMWIADAETVERGQRLQKATRKYRSAIQVTRSSFNAVDLTAEREAARLRLIVADREQRIDELSEEIRALTIQMEDAMDRAKDLAVDNNRLRDQLRVNATTTQGTGNE